MRFLFVSLDGLGLLGDPIWPFFFRWFMGNGLYIYIYLGVGRNEIQTYEKKQLYRSAKVLKF